MKRLFSLALCLLLLVTPALAVADRPANGYVGDYADVLDADLERDIIARNEALFQSTGAQVAVAAVDFMDGLDAEAYAAACFDAWGVGDATRNNGLLLVFAVGENKVWAMRGTGLEEALSAATLNGWLEDYFYDPYDAGDYNTATKDFFRAACDWMESYYAGSGNTVPGGVPAQPDQQPGGLGRTVGGLVVFTICIIVAVLVFALIATALSRVHYGGVYYYAPYRPWPFFFGRRRRRYGPPPPAPPRPPSYRPHTGGGFHIGGVSRGGGAGRRGSGSAGSFRASGRSSFRSGGGGSFRSGGHSRGGGAGRR